MFDCCGKRHDGHPQQVGLYMTMRLPRHSTHPVILCCVSIFLGLLPGHSAPKKFMSAFRCLLSRSLCNVWAFEAEVNSALYTAR